jgi:uncharacterized protein (TIGR02996 family)
MNREALIAAVLADPDDDTPRLVFADWLDEHGEHERAEVIRVGCRLVEARRRKRHKLARGLRDQQDRLLSKKADRSSPCNAALWVGEAGMKFSPHWSRGFVYGVAGAAARWVAEADALLRGHPVTEVELTTTPELQTAAGGLKMGLRGDPLRRTYSHKKLWAGASPGEGWSPLLGLLRRRWPRIRTWHLPPARPSAWNRLRPATFNPQVPLETV